MTESSAQPAQHRNGHGNRGDANVAIVDDSAVRVITDRVQAQLEAITTRMIARYREEIVDYRLVDDEMLDHDVYGVSLAGLKVMVANLASGRLPTLEQLEETRAAAARRVHQHVSLESFLHAWRLWGQTVWEAVLDSAHADVPAEREAALRIAGALLEHLDVQSVAAAQGYLGELQSVWSDREVVRRDLLDGLIGGHGGSEPVRRLARSLRQSLHENYLVVIVRADECPSEATPEPSLAARAALRRIAEVVRRHLRPQAGSLMVGIREGQVIALYPFAHVSELDALKQSCHGLAEDLASRHGRVGLSGARLGLGELPLSYAEAREAAEIATQAGTRGHVVAFDDVMIDSIVRSSPHSERILESTIAPLKEYDECRQAELVTTLRAYIESGLSLAKSAEALCVHPNTVVYRLGRIKELSGRDPHSSSDLLLLHLGLKLDDLGSEPERKPQTAQGPNS